MTNPFRAYDIRGVYPEDVNESLVEKVIPVLVEEFFGDGEVVVGHDPRIGSEELYRKTIEELKENDVDIIEAGLITTPMLTFLVLTSGVGGGIIVTASHNPKEYNGLKVLNADAVPISGEEIENRLYHE